MAQTDCRWFSGYKPCGKSPRCTSECSHKSVVSRRIVIVHLEALGAVLRATSLLAAIRRKYPESHITWVTKAPADQLLKENPFIDRILTLSLEDLLVLENFEFDIGFCIDKSLVATGLLKRLRIRDLRGFTASSSGAILPATVEAEELWQLGLDDHKKFHVNQKPETQLMVEALRLGPFQRDEYVLKLSDMEKKVAQLRRELWAPRGEVLVGLNTGCASVIPYKKMSIAGHRQLIAAIQQHFPQIRIVLLGGREDKARNEAIAEGFDVVRSPTDSGLRDGLCSVEACDLVVSGDSLGMHMAIALKKWVVVWFGPTCSQEIDLYGRGDKVQAQVGCSPCWKRSCLQDVMCYDRVPLDRILESLKKGIAWKSSLSRPPFSETSSSVFP